MKYRDALIKRIKTICGTHKLAARIFILLLLASSALIAIFSYFQNRTLRTLFTEAQSSYSKIYLEGVIRNTDQLFNGLNQNISQFVANTSVQSLLYAHSADEFAANRVRLTMSEIEDKNLQIENMILYLKRSDTVVTSTLLTPRENSAYYQLIDAYSNNTIYMDKISLDGIVCRLFTYDNKLILERSLPFENTKSIASMFCILNENSIYRQLTDSPDVYIFNSQSQKICSNAVNYTDEIVDIFQKMHMEGLTSMDGADEHHLITLAQSGSTKWYYLYISDNSDLIRSNDYKNRHRFLTFVLPIAFLILLCAGLLAYYVEYPYLNVFKRLRKASQTEPLPDEIPVSSDPAHIAAMLTDIQKQNTQLENTLQKVRPDVTYRIFSNLLVGKQYQPDELKYLLTNIQSPFTISAHYFVCIIRGRKQPLGLKERKRFVQILREHSENFCQRNHVIMHILHINTDIVIVLAAAKNTDSISVSKCISSLNYLVEMISSENGVFVDCQTGRVCFSLLDIYFSYQDALEYLNSGEIPSKPPKASAPAQQKPSEKAIQFLNYLYEKDQENAKILLKRTWKENIEDSEDLSTAKNKCYDFCSTLMNILFTHETYKNLPISQDFFSFLDENEDFRSEEHLLQYFQTHGDRITEQLSLLIKKQQNHHLISAQKYIQENFSDSMLSLSSVAAAVNMNTSYLSKLFKTNLGVNFVDYLNNYRISESQKLLRETNTSIKDIGSSCGFNSVQNYIRVFKKYIGVTPGQYRTQISEQNN